MSNPTAADVIARLTKIIDMRETARSFFDGDADALASYDDVTQGIRLALHATERV